MIGGQTREVSLYMCNWSTNRSKMQLSPSPLGNPDYTYGIDLNKQIQQFKYFHSQAKQYLNMYIHNSSGTKEQHISTLPIFQETDFNQLCIDCLIGV